MSLPQLQTAGRCEDLQGGGGEEQAGEQRAQNLLSKEQASPEMRRWEAQTSGSLKTPGGLEKDGGEATHRFPGVTGELQTAWALREQLWKGQLRGAMLRSENNPQH